jgi:hypothetical protein
VSAPQSENRFAWCLNIQSSPAITSATMDLPVAAAATLGAVYTARIKSWPQALQTSLPNLFYGFADIQGAEFVLSNVDGALDPTLEWRLVPVTLIHYDLDSDTAVTEFTGVITHVQFQNATAILTLGAINPALMNEQLPAATIDPVSNGPFTSSGTPGLPIPMIFGDDVPVKPPSLAVDTISDPGGYDYAVSHGKCIVTGAFLDSDQSLPGLEALGTWQDGPGNPTYVDPSHFDTSGVANVDQTARYGGDIGGVQLRFHPPGSTDWIYTSVATVNPVTAAQPSGAWAWYDAAAVTQPDNTTMARWPDKSGNARHALQPLGANRPLFRTGIVNGLPVVRFDAASSKYLVLPDISALTSGEIFIVVKITTDPPVTSAKSGLWHFSDATSSVSGFPATHYPFTDGTIYEAFGTDTRKTTVNPTPALTSWRVYNVSAASADWTNRLDGVQLTHTGTNAVSFSSTVYLGRSHGGTGDSFADYYLDGDVAEVIIYGGVLTSDQRTDIVKLLSDKYGLALSSSRSVLNIATVDPVLVSGFTNLQTGVDPMITLPGSYQSISTGLLPVPADPGADITAVRTFSPEDGSFIVTASNPLYPTATTHIADVLATIITDSTWGLSAPDRITNLSNQQVINTSSFAAANVALGLAGLTGAISGALGYDQNQRRAGDVLDELMMMRGITSWLDGSQQWNVLVDTQPSAASKTFVLGPGATGGTAIPIKRVEFHGKTALDQAVRNVVLHWQTLGRDSSSKQAKFSPRDYARTSRAAVTGIGADRHFYSQWIRDPNIAEAVAFYLAEKLKGADETLIFAAGVEARDVALGEKITVSIPMDGISNVDFQVYAITKTLNEVTLSCFKVNDNAYTSPSGVVTSDPPDDTDFRVPADNGTNLIPNPGFAPPLGLFNVPHAWTLLAFGPPLSAFTPTTATSSGVAVDYDSTVLSEMVGGHYFKITWTSVPLSPSTSPAAIFSVPFAARAGRTDMCFFSVYCDQTDGVYLAIEELGLTQTAKLLPTIYDPTDTNGAGWGRYYARTRLKSDTTTVRLAICVNKDCTAQFDAADFRVTNGTTKTPPTWARHRAQALTLTTSAEVTFSGGTTATATNLIPAGAMVTGVVSRITQAFVFGTATGYSIGTAENIFAWGEDNTSGTPVLLTATALDSVTSAANYTVGGEIYFPTDTSVIVTGNGTITSGKIRLTVEYTLSGPASAA